MSVAERVCMAFEQKSQVWGKAVTRQDCRILCNHTLEFGGRPVQPSGVGIYCLLALFDRRRSASTIMCFHWPYWANAATSCCLATGFMTSPPI